MAIFFIAYVQVIQFTGILSVTSQCVKNREIVNRKNVFGGAFLNGTIHWLFHYTAAHWFKSGIRPKDEVWKSAEHERMSQTFFFFFPLVQYILL